MPAEVRQFMALPPLADLLSIEYLIDQELDWLDQELDGTMRASDKDTSSKVNTALMFLPVIGWLIVAHKLRKLYEDEP